MNILFVVLNRSQTGDNTLLILLIIIIGIGGLILFISKYYDYCQKNNKEIREKEEAARKKEEHERWEKMTPEERELDMKYAKRQMDERQRLNNQLQSALQGGLSSTYAKSLMHEVEELDKEGERWKTLSIEEKRRELGILSNTTQTSSPLNMRLEFNLPRTCPKCNQLVNWKYVDSEKTETLDSAYRVMGSTTVFTKEKITRRFICDKCGFEMKR